MRYTQSNLQKIEQILRELSYTIRYEKGHFKSGYCIVEHKKVVVVNRFYEPEERMNSLIDILSRIEIDRAQLSEGSRKLLDVIFDGIAATESDSIGNQNAGC